MVTADDVRMAYRLILGREPENEEVVANFQMVGSLHELRSIFMRSEEFRSKVGRPRLEGVAKPDMLEFAPPRRGLRLDECSFYHTMEIPGIGLVTGWGWDHRTHVDDMFRGIDFSGKRVLEVGPASGFLTSVMDQRGADVVSIEAPEFHKWDIIPFPGYTDKWQRSGEEVWEKNTNAWWFVHEHCKLRANVCYVGAYDLDTVPLGRFDTSVLFHVLLHARDPLKIIQHCAAITDREIIIGEMVHGIESLQLPIINLLAHPEDEENFNAWWRFSSTFFVTFLAVCGFTKSAVHRYCLTYKGIPHENFTVVASRP